MVDIIPWLNTFSWYLMVKLATIVNDTMGKKFTMVNAFTRAFKAPATFLKSLLSCEGLLRRDF